MATGRILKTQISLSEQVNDLPLDAALLFTWMIPHADDFGRITGSARKIKALVVPMRDDFTAASVEKCLLAIERQGLVQRYEIEGEKYIQFPTWEAHQQGLHKRTRSKLPPPPDKKFPGISGKFIPEQEQEQEQEQDISATSEISLGAEDEKKIDSVIQIPLNDNSERAITEAEYAEMVSLYPAIDVLSELRKARGWCLGNKSRRKTRAGVMRFLHGWLGKAQDRSSGLARASPQFRQSPAEPKSRSKHTILA